jgi:hypothetical protein
MSAHQAVHTRAEVADALERIAARHPQDGGPSMLARVIDWIAEHLFSAGGADAARVSALIVKLLAGAIAATVVTMLVLWLVGRFRARGRGPGEPEIVRRRVAELRALAREARARGDAVLALRYLLFALVVGLGQKGDLRYRDAWTNRELLERGEPSADVRGLLAPLLIELEAKEFGRAPVEPADVDRLVALCDRWLGPEAAA